MDSGTQALSKGLRGRRRTGWRPGRKRRGGPVWAGRLMARLDSGTQALSEGLRGRRRTGRRPDRKRRRGPVWAGRAFATGYPEGRKAC